MLEKRRQEGTLDSGEETPDPQSAPTFLYAKLAPQQRNQGHHATLFNFYKELIRLRKECLSLNSLSRAGLEIIVSEDDQLLTVIRTFEGEQTICLFNYSGQNRAVQLPTVSGTLLVLLDSCGSFLPGSRVTLTGDRSAACLTLTPFGVMVLQKMDDASVSAAGAKGDI